MSTFKHFPGHGATEADTHEGYAYTNATYEELMATELQPFSVAQMCGVDLVMVAHISAPNVVGDDTPCSLSEKMITGILRTDLGYDGLVITDAMNMGAIAKNYDSGIAAKMAVKAIKTTDTIYLPIRETYEAESMAKTEIVYRNTGFAKFCITFFWLAIAAVVGYIAIRIIRARL